MGGKRSLRGPRVRQQRWALLEERNHPPACPSLTLKQSFAKVDVLAQIDVEMEEDLAPHSVTSANRCTFNSADIIYVSFVTSFAARTQPRFEQRLIGVLNFVF
jgi:hypothetical protein